MKSRAHRVGHDTAPRRRISAIRRRISDVCRPAKVRRTPPHETRSRPTGPGGDARAARTFSTRWIAFGAAKPVVRVDAAWVSRVVRCPQGDAGAHVLHDVCATDRGQGILQPRLEAGAALQDQVSLLDGGRRGRSDLELVRLGARLQQDRERDIVATHLPRRLATCVVVATTRSRPSLGEGVPPLHPATAATATTMPESRTRRRTAVRPSRRLRPGTRRSVRRSRAGRHRSRIPSPARGARRSV